MADVPSLGHICSEYGKKAEAEAMYVRALQGKEKAWGPEHTSTLKTVKNLGNLYAAQGKMSEAEAMYVRALQGYKKAMGTDYPETRLLPAIWMHCVLVLEAN